MGDILYRAERIVLQREEGLEGWGCTSGFTGRARKLESVYFAPLVFCLWVPEKEVKNPEFGSTGPTQR